MIVHINEIYLILNYLITAILSIVIALGLGFPLLPRKPIRFSYDKSAIYPTPLFALGILAICFSLNFYWIYNGMVLAIFLAIVSALFVKYGFDYVFPEFRQGEDNQRDVDQDGENQEDVENKEISSDMNFEAKEAEK